MPFTNLPYNNIQTTNYTLLLSDDVVEFNLAGNATATLPSAANITGKRFTIKRIDVTSATMSVATTGGQTIDGRASGSIKLSVGNFGTFVSDGSNWVSIVLYETISARVQNGSATITASDSIVKHSSTIHDTHSAYSAATGFFTCPVAGYYICSVNVDVASSTFTPTQFATASINKNGSFVNGNVAKGATGNSDLQATACFTILCAAGDTISQAVASNATSPTIGSANYTWLSVTKQ